MLKIIIVDDEANVRQALGQMLRLFSEDTQLIGSYSNVAAAVKAIREDKPDIVLLDIEIGKDNGFDVLKHFPSPGFKVIFITGYQQYAVQAFRFAALDYLLKPVDPDQLSDAIKKAFDAVDREKFSLKIDSFIHNMGTMANKAKKIILRTADNMHIVNLNDIMYCESERSYTTFFLADKTKVMVSQTLGDYEDMFNEYGFMRIHKSYLINLQFIKRYEKGDGGTVILNGNISLPVATRKKEQLLVLLAKL
jgi:two-component system LytT family response regulator